MQSCVSGFVIHLRIGLSEVEGDAFLGALGVNRMEEAPVIEMEGDVRKLDLSHLCFSLNFYFLMFLRLFPSMFPLLTYSQSFIPLIC